MAENPSNIVPDQIILLEGGSKLVPAPSSSDSGKVLSVLNSDGDIGWAEGQGGGGTVDQTYDATSTNAQSGTAVAEAISGQASCQLVEGAGIDLTESNGSLVIAATVDQTYDATSADAQSGVAVAGALANINQVPASAQADEGKALVVDANGDPVWDNVPTGPTYSPGTMIDLTNDQISVDTSAGIEDIALVNTLPVSPDANTLYLIPEV